MIKYNHHITIRADHLDRRDYATRAIYEHHVEKVLNRLHKTKTGEAVLHQLDVGKKSLTIMPYNVYDVAHDPFNAYAQSQDPDHSTRKGGTWKDTAGGIHKGLGGGSDSVIHFSASTWFSFMHKHMGHTSGAHPDEILLHEMVHSLRQMIGTSETVALGYMYDDEEEFFAILIANIYASELNRPIDIRANHAGFDHIAAKIDTDEEFLPAIDPKKYRYRLVDKLIKQEPRLCHALAQVDADFNPIRRYFDLQRSKYYDALIKSSPLIVAPPPKPIPAPANGGLFGTFGNGRTLGHYA